MNRNFRFSKHKQRGVVLFFALIALIAITLAALSLMRSRDNAVVIAGNLAFRQAAVAGADLALEKARDWIMANAVDDIGTGLNTSKPDSGYYSSAVIDLGGGQLTKLLDVTASITPSQSADNVNWDGKGTGLKAFAVPQDAYAQAVSQNYAYIIRRLCNKENLPVQGLGQECAVYSTKGSSDSKTDQSQGNMNLSGSISGYYQVTVRVTGPKNTVSYVQTVIML
ncbi:Tfp pilus assembly protein PilX [Chitinivorax tropicus]|uniref:Tfp pilus assembly protein PilX n=1 Tax=Chitinivorax tropicus TaxID=714531 RepID=A0A840MKV5_9PROT|nr:hypothetical protein [Chitinivorax tropicus]MBB5019804.1 Tfp pilus assembly protein PilX [Chitinivorax tropicus]